MRLVTTGELAKELSVSNSAVLKWVRRGQVRPQFTTPGGHHRWDVALVRAQIEELRANEHED